MYDSIVVTSNLLSSFVPCAPNVILYNTYCNMKPSCNNYCNKRSTCNRVAITLIAIYCNSKHIPPEWAGRNNNTITRGQWRTPGQHGSSEFDANHRLVLAVKRMTWIKGKHRPRRMTCAKSRSVTLALAGLKLDDTFKLQR